MGDHVSITEHDYRMYICSLDRSLMHSNAQQEVALKLVKFTGPLVIYSFYWCTLPTLPMHVGLSTFSERLCTIFAQAKTTGVGQGC